MPEVKDEIARAHLQAHQALDDAAVALKQQEKITRIVNRLLGDADTPETQDARRALNRLRALTHNTLIRVRSAQMNLYGIPVDGLNNHKADLGRHSDHRSRDTTRS